MAMQEFSFSVDDFQNPKVLKDGKAITTLLVRLLLLEPGTIQSHPEAGVGLISRYRFSQEGIASELQAEFQKQLELYFPQFQGVRINVIEKEGAIIISAEIDDKIYGIYFDKTTSEIKSTYTNLDKL